MHGLVLVLFLAAAFAGGVAAGLAGFATGLVVSGLWLHILTPLQTTSLIVGYGLITQGYGIWTFRRAFSWRHVVPLVIGGALGAPLGTWFLHGVNPGYLRLGVGVLLIAYGLFGLQRPRVIAAPGGVALEGGIGFLNGVLGGMTGLAGVFVTIWCGVRGWSKDFQRSVYQPVIFAAFVVTAVSLAVSGAITGEFVRLYLLGAPAILAGMLVGYWLYGRLDDATFRKLILLLLLLSGLALLAPQLLLL